MAACCHGGLEMELSRYLRVLRRWLSLLVLCPLLATLGAAAVSVLLPPVYEAKVSILVKPAQPLTTTDPTSSALTADEISRTYAQLITQRPILEQVIRDLKLHVKVDDFIKQI